MKRTVLVFGLIMGAILTGFMIYASLSCYYNPEFKGNDVLGYAGMLLVLSLIFVGVKNYRDKYNGGIISFGKAFKTGALIALIASTMYTAVWLVEYYVFIPDFLDKYIPHAMKNAAADGASAEKLKQMEQQMNMTREMYKTPLGVTAITYIEVLPIGLIVALISALILKRKAKPAEPAV